MIPTVKETTIKVDLYWKCYAYGDELAPYIEFLEGIMASSTRDISPSCVENVEELIERQEKSLSQLDAKKNPVADLIAKVPKNTKFNIKFISNKYFFLLKGKDTPWQSRVSKIKRHCVHFQSLTSKLSRYIFMS